MDEERNELVKQLQLQMAIMELKLKIVEAERDLRRPYVESVFQPTSPNCGSYDMGYNAIEWQPPLEYGNYLNSWDYENSFATQGGFQMENSHYQEMKPSLEEMLSQFTVTTEARMAKMEANMKAQETRMVERQIEHLTTTMETQRIIDEWCEAVSQQNRTSHEESIPLSSKEFQIAKEQSQVVQEEQEEKDEDQFSKSLEVESPTLFVNQPLQLHEDEDFTNFKECKILNAIDPYLGTDNSTRACFFHFYLSPSFNFYDDLPNMELFEYDFDLDGAQDHHDPYDVSRIAKPPYYWVATYGALKFDEKWPPPMPPP